MGQKTITRAVVGIPPTVGVYAKMEKRTVLLTGAAGRVGTLLRQHWGARYHLRLTDVCPISDLAEHEEYYPFDMTCPESCDRVCRDVHTVVHLAADAGSEDFIGSLLPRNIVGPYNVFTAAARATCRRLIFTSSIYAVRGHGPNPPIEPDRPVFPQGLYGATNCWGEALARVCASRHRLSTVVLRLGNPTFDQAGDWDADEPSYMISPRETAALFAHCIDVEDVEFAIVHGSSLHRRPWLGLEFTRALLGYDPQDGTAFPPNAKGKKTK